MDTKLLMEIFHIPSRSGEEDFMQEFVCRKLKEYGKEYEVDEMGNVYNISYQDKPLLNAHLDTVQDIDDSRLQKFAKIRGNILSGYGVIGADDKCGVFIVLELLKEFDTNFLFSVQEEVGCKGAHHFEEHNTFDFIPYGLTFDRKGDSDIICYYNDYGTKDFEDKLHEIGIGFGYSPNSGILSDADALNEQISTCNLSVGYYNHHTKGEFVVLSELGNAIAYAKKLVSTIDENYSAPEKFRSYYNEYFHHLYDEEEIVKEVNTSPKCFITGDKHELFYLDSVGKFISRRGAQILLSDLDDSGVMQELYETMKYEDALNTDFEELESIEEEFNKMLDKG